MERLESSASISPVTKIKSRYFLSRPDAYILHMTLKELEPQLLALTPTEKAEVIQILTKNLSNGSRGITKTPDVCGGDACIDKTRIPVWLMVSWRRQGMSDAELLNLYPHLTAADLVNVWAYADAHTDEIEEAIRNNDEAMQEDEED
jgi:uncharacterized protein (DUF433 family)